MTTRSTPVQCLAATAFAALGCTASAFENPVVERYVAPPAGFSWTELRRSTGALGKAEETATFRVGRRHWKGADLIAFEADIGTLLIDANGGWVARLSADGKPVSTWDPPLSLPYPLEVSKSWTRTHRVVDAAGKADRLDLSCRIENYTEVIVPAGAFRAFEIHCRDSRGVETTVWHDPSLGIWVKSSVSAGAAGGMQGTRKQELLSVSDQR